MLFQITELKQFLLSITKNKIDNIYIKSKDLQLTINTVKQKNEILLNTKTNYKIADQNRIIDKVKTKSTKSKNVKGLKEQNTYFTILSPMIGTFYRSPAPNELPFIEKNDSVTINQTVCIIEAMKLMNEIESEVNGNIVEILVEDGDIVDCGQALMRVQQQ